MKFKTLTKHIKTDGSRTKTYYPDVDSLEQFVDFDTNNFVSICGRPSTGKTTVLIDILLSRNQLKNEKSLFLYADSSSVRKLERKVGENHNSDNIIVAEKNFENTDQIIPILELAIMSFTNEKSDSVSLDAIYIDDFDQYFFDFIEEEIELHQESLRSSFSFKKTKTTLDYLLSTINKTYNINIFLTGHVSRRCEIRGGEKRPRLSDIENPLLEKVSSKLLLLYRPENYGLPCDEKGDDISNIVFIDVPINNDGGVNFSIKHRIEGYF